MPKIYRRINEADLVWDNIHILSRYSRRLSLLGNIAAIGTAGNTAALFIMVSVFLVPGNPIGHRYFHILFPFSVVLALISIAAVVFFESLRKRAETLFEEISDEFQWQIKSFGSKSGGEQPRSRPDLDVRIALRNFAKSGDLPLIPGKFGPTLYAITNLIVTITFALQHRFFV